MIKIKAELISLFLILPSIAIASEGSHVDFPLWTSVFFVGLLLSIAICEENHIKMPSFFGYMAWSAGILIPVFVAVTFVFFWS